jgi:dinuclear metal center YbgI/SA1388 family protein
MSVSLHKLRCRLDEILEPQKFRDYCPNGLQVEGRPEVHRLISGVTACQQLIDAAVAAKADAVLVHHGFFWRGESSVITGMKRRRIAALLANDVSLLAYHLPLDAHPQFGNNACLAQLLEIAVEGELDPADPSVVGNFGSLAAAIPVSQLLERIQRQLQRQPLHVGDKEAVVRKVAWCSGGAQGYIEQAINVGADVFITGEASEQTVHVAREEGIQFIAAGHHATERYGVQALAAELAGEFGLEHSFIDIDNPV